MLKLHLKNIFKIKQTSIKKKKHPSGTNLRSLERVTPDSDKGRGVAVLVSEELFLSAPLDNMLSLCADSSALVAFSKESKNMAAHFVKKKKPKHLH